MPDPPNAAPGWERGAQTRHRRNKSCQFSLHGSAPPCDCSVPHPSACTVGSSPWPCTRLHAMNSVHGHGNPRGHWGWSRAQGVLQQALPEVQRAGPGSLRSHRGQPVHREPEPCSLSVQLLVFHTHLLQKEAFAWCC